MAKSNLVIGTTTLAVIAAAFAGLLGYQKIHALRQQAPLRIVFEGSASGLRKGGSVNFDGVQIGVIKSLKLDNPRKIVALVMVDNSAPDPQGYGGRRRIPGADRRCGDLADRRCGRRGRRCRWMKTAFRS